MVVRGRRAKRDASTVLRADYALFFKPSIPLVVVEAKDNHHAVGAGMAQAIHYAELLEPAVRDRCVFRTPKMVLAVGERECAFLRERFQRFSPHFPAMELLDKQQIAEWEPQVAMVNGQLRPEELAAIGIRSTYTAVDYEELAESFVNQARSAVAGP